MPIQHFTERPSQCNEIREGSKRYRYLEEKNGIIIINNKKTPGINKPGVYVNKFNILSIYNYYIINILITILKECWLQTISNGRVWDGLLQTLPLAWFHQHFHYLRFIADALPDLKMLWTSKKINSIQCPQMFMKFS